MEEALKEVLEPDEKLLWSGRPESFVTLDKTHKSGFIRTAVITVAVCVALIVAYILSIARTGADFKAGLVAIIVAIAAYVIVSTFLNAGKLRKKLGYAITDKRLLIISDSAKGVGYEKIPIAALKQDEDGHSSLLCGVGAVNESPRKWRSSALVGARLDMDSGVCEALVMYAIPDAQKVKELLKPYLTLN